MNRPWGVIRDHPVFTRVFNRSSPVRGDDIEGTGVGLKLEGSMSFSLPLFLSFPLCMCVTNHHGRSLEGKRYCGRVRGGEKQKDLRKF